MSKPATMVRVYVTEGDKQYKKIMQLLQSEFTIGGMTAFRGIAGFGHSGDFHGGSVFSNAFDMPIVIEFFDDEEKIEAVLQKLNDIVAPGHIVSWRVNTNKTD